MSDSLEFNVDLSNYSGSLEILLDLFLKLFLLLELLYISRKSDKV